MKMPVLAKAVHPQNDLEAPKEPNLKSPKHLAAGVYSSS